MSQELVNSVNKLTDETSALLQEYVKGNTVLQNSASEAASSAAAAKVSEGITIDKANVATQKAAEAKQFRDETAAVATGGTATLDPTPGKIPLADSEGKIHTGWLPVNVAALSEAIVEAIRDLNKEQYAASGFIHYGKHYTESIAPNVNEGMTCAANTPNNVAIGRATSQITGSSETNYAVMNVAGFTSNLITSETHSMFTIKFPEAPNGTVVSDSSGNCRGTGKPTLDLSKEVDPKYGDVADSVNEAVARAFEGIIKNGDFRKGTDRWSAANGTISEGRYTSNILGDLVYNGGYGALLEANSTYTVEYVGVIPSGATNVTFQANTDTGSNYSGTTKAGNGEVITERDTVFTTKFNVTTGGSPSLSLRVYHAQANVEVRCVRIYKVTEEVVINRVDMAGLEFFKEKVGAYLYPYGMIQSKATTVDGVATTEDTVRPITYFAVFEGDTTSRGRGWKLADLTFVQLATIMSNPEHNAWYNEAGELMQFRCRQRTVAGLGNGDWRVANPKGDILSFGTENLTRVAAQGGLDNPAGTSSGGNFFAGYTFTGHNKKPEVGMFTVSSNSGEYQAPDGECYFYVLATVPRLNQGAYHPSFNPMGADKAANVAHTGSVFWYELGNETVTTLKTFLSRSAGGIGHNGSGWGSISSNISGRPDGRFYDAIYASGQGGVIDWRLPARDMSSKEDADAILQKVVNGTYRGLEKLAFFTPNAYGADGDLVGFYYPTPTSDNRHGLVYSPELTTAFRYGDARAGDTFFITNGTDYVGGKLIRWNGNSSQCDFTDSVASPGMPSGAALKYSEGWRLWAVKRTDTNISVSGDFTTQSVIGSPVEILATPQLANGWLGSWAGVLLADGNAYNTPLTRKSLSSTASQTYSTDNGSSWLSGSKSINTTTNAVNVSTSVGVEIIIIEAYTAFAKQTKSSVNKPVLKGSEGIGDVISVQSHATYYGNTLMESFISKVGTSSVNGHAARGSGTPYDYYFSGDFSGKLGTFLENLPRHEPINSPAPNNNSPAVKTLWHQASNNQQATLNFLWNELVFDTNWRTPDKVWSGGSVSVAVGETFRAESSSAYAVAGLLMRCVKAVTANASVLGAMHVLVGGDVMSLTDGQTYFKVVNNGWSDDSTIRIIDGVGTFNNENGDTCLYGTDELAMPYGYTQNQAGAGKQVVGVDL
ncbi:TPA: hypothetical protein RQL23_000418 [Vibrio vulnificus]|nr:hypothetical protein [Vibrio vulnificus]